MTIEEVIKNLNTSLEGLSENEAKKRVEKFGYNEIVKKKGISKISIFLRQFKSFLVLILIAAAIISIFIGEILDAVVILIIVVLNAIFGFFQEYKAEKAMAALKKLTAPKAKVIREGKINEIDSIYVVPGDILVLNEGDKVAADCRLIESISMRVDESALTGESSPVSKVSDSIKKDVQISEMKNMAFMGTTVTYGRGRGVVVSTGMKTEFGKIAGMVAESEEQTPLQIRLSKFGKQLGIIILIICAIVTVFGIVKGNPPIDMFITGVALAVAAIPEGLPAVVTITLALGMQKMANRNAIVRRLPAVETLGCVTVICSDKTGTLTKNEMTVKKIYCDEKLIDVTGDGYKIEGNFYIENKKIDPKKDANLSILLKTAVLCNNASLTSDGIIGDPTEGSLLVLAAKAGVKKEDLQKKNIFVKEIPFSSERKMMSVVYKSDKETAAYVKGATEIIVRLCNRIYRDGEVKKISKKDVDRILEINKRFAENALRVLAFAYKEVDSGYEEKDLIFIGLVGMIDPLRPEVKNAVNVCKNAGIEIIMITGDNEITAKAIAKELGIFKHGDKIITGLQLEKMGDEELKKNVNDIRVYARVSPQHKVRIIDALREKNHIIAMTGDGVNDAPALKKADIGIAMGVKGTEVAQEASDIVLKDDNFATIVNAVEEGRVIYDNIKKFVQYLLYANMGEVLLIFIAMIIGFSDPHTGLLVLPLIPVQILWLNLITDGLPALALGVDPPAKDIMKRKPRDPKENILTKNTIKAIILFGFIISMGSLLIFSIYLSESVEKARTMAFTTIMLFELFLAIGISTRSGSKINKKLMYAVIISIFLHILILYVPFLQMLFETTSITFSDWVIAASMPFIVLVFIDVFEIFKKIY